MTGESRREFDHKIGAGMEAIFGTAPLVQERRLTLWTKFDERTTTTASAPVISRDRLIWYKCPLWKGLYSAMIPTIFLNKGPDLPSWSIKNKIDRGTVPVNTEGGLDEHVKYWFSTAAALL